MTTRRRLIGIAVLAALVSTVAAATVWFRWGGTRGTPPPAVKKEVAKRPPVGVRPKDKPVAAPVEEPPAVVREFCSTCHALPPADCQPKWAWKARIEWMYWWAKGPRPVPEKDIPPIEVPIEYFTTHAPDELQLPDDAMGSPISPLPFQLCHISLDVIPDPPAISNVKVVRLTDEGPNQLLMCDMRHGLLVLSSPLQEGEPDKVIGRVPHPSHTQVIDLDGDGARDILVADLGEFWPVDTAKGSVVWLRNRGDGQFDPLVLLEGLGRINDVQAADFDADGDLDLVVAVFGNFTTGRIVFMENLTEDYSQPEFDPIVLDDRHGTMYVPVVDVNQDGHPDFIAAMAQEHESVVAFLNRGWGSFRQQTIYQAPHCLWGSTGIRLVDLNSDGRLDVVHVNGDMVEYPAAMKPYHGLAWLENRGSYPYAYHRLTHLPGVHVAMPVDLDGDGMLDLVAGSLLPNFNPAAPIARELDSIIWLRQTLPGQFQRYSLERGMPFHPCGDVMDIDGDGDMDVVLGNFTMFPSMGNSLGACLTIVENRLVSPGQRLSP